MQQPSSLIFLVIIAVWAVYFVQHWVRRREHLATARSVDQFSESLRVLERRTPLPASDLSTPVRPSYAVSPARAARPQVLVKRAESAPVSSPVSSAVSSSSSASVRPPRKVRGLVLLASLVAVPVMAVCTVFGPVPVWSVLVALVAVGASVAWLRAAVTAERAARVAARPRAEAPLRRRVVEPAAAPARPSTRTVRDAVPTTSAEPAEHAGATRQPGADADADSTPAPQELYDGAAVEVGARTGAPAARPRPLVDEDDIPLTWDPVPVPPPTYTMKARVTRPAPTSADLVGDADTEYTTHADEPVRRVAGA